MVELQSIFSEKQRQMLASDSPTPLYHQLYSLLKTCILDGTFEKNMKLPTEKQLSDEFGISRITAKRSLDELAEENLVERHRGKGTHVIYEYKPKPVPAPLEAMLQEIESMARHSNAVILDASMLQPPQNIRDEFGIDPGESLLYLARARERDGLRFGYYISWTLGVNLPENPRVFEDTPRLAYFREQGMEVTHVKQTLRAVSAKPDAAEVLGVEPGSPLLSLLRRSYNKVGKKELLTDYLLALYHPERFQYRMDLTLND
jgi:GntR family transcriptional regulator